MPERPNDTTPPRVPTEAERVERARLRRVLANASALPDTPPPIPAAPLDAGLADLAGLWLVLRCKCG